MSLISELLESGRSERDEQYIQELTEKVNHFREHYIDADLTDLPEKDKMVLVKTIDSEWWVGKYTDNSFKEFNLKHYPSCYVSVKKIKSWREIE